MMKDYEMVGCVLEILMNVPKILGNTDYKCDTQHWNNDVDQLKSTRNIYKLAVYAS
jgi:hypothetical protein